jgi:hypothetical protein
MSKVHDLSPVQLADALHEGAAGYYPAEAAVALLVEHGSWLHRDDFRTFIDYSDDEPRSIGRAPMAWVQWGDAVAAGLPASSSEQAILQIAASLAGRSIPVALSHVLGGLDGLTIAAVVTAVIHANGNPALATSVAGMLGGDRR